MLRFQPNRGSSAVVLVSTFFLQAITADGWTTVGSTPYAVLTTDFKLWVTVNPCTVVFPLSVTMEHDVLVKDGAGGAFANNIHNTFTGGEICDGSADRKITTDRGFLVIGPKPTDDGYTLVG